MTSTHTARHRETGVATLVVVMMLFLVMAMLAAYANRSVLFEQRMAVSYSRANLAQEAAEGGIEWTLAQLNGSAVDTACKPVAEGGRRFVDRYLQLDTANRVISEISGSTTGLVDCAKNSATGTWACRCPDPATPRVAASPLAGPPTSSFIVRMGASQAAAASPQGRPRPGSLQINVIGCTDSVVDTCLAADNETSSLQVGKSTVSVLVGLVGAVRNPPAAPLVVKGNLTTTGGQGLGLHNSDPTAGGMLALVGGSWTPSGNRRLDTIPGTPPDQALSQPDATLRDLSVDDVFKKFMGASPARYKLHPSLRVVSCNGECSDAIDTALKAGQRILWVDGPLTIDSSRTFGSATDPIVLISTGAVTLSGSFRMSGMLVAQGDVSWTNSGGVPAVLNGVALVGGTMTTTGGMDINYQQAIVDQLRNRLGSYVRVPGSWLDRVKL